MKRLIPLLALALGAQLAVGGPLIVQWSDPAGDASTAGDVAGVQLQWDASGHWTATWNADPAHPFTGNARFNLNLFDTALGNLGTATAPQLSLDALHDFGSGTALVYSYAGQSPYLADWQVGDIVSTGNGSHFVSGLVDLDAIGSRDNLLTQAPVTASVPEPGSWPLIVIALGVLVLSSKRPRR
jgi:hypothetical protein